MRGARALRFRLGRVYVQTCDASGLKFVLVGSGVVASLGKLVECFYTLSKVSALCRAIGVCEVKLQLVVEAWGALHRGCKAPL